MESVASILTVVINKRDTQVIQFMETLVRLSVVLLPLLARYVFHADGCVQTRSHSSRYVATLPISVIPIEFGCRRRPGLREGVKLRSSTSIPFTRLVEHSRSRILQVS
jgi:hypothetical protein